MRFLGIVQMSLKCAAPTGATLLHSQELIDQQAVSRYEVV